MSVVAKVEELLSTYDSTQYDTLPKFIKRRADALKKIQLDHIKIQHEYHMELQQLELKYDKLYQPLYEKRYKITTGEYEPTDEDCQLPANIVENDFNGDQENNHDPVTILTEEQEQEVKNKVKGVPFFWLGTLQSSYNFSDSIEDHDKAILKHLKDIRLTYDNKDDLLTYKIDFLFEPNPFFTNEVLSKTYFLKMKPDEKDPFSYEGFEVCKSEGCEISWNQGKDATVKTVTVRQQNKSDGRTREKKKEVERDSFFYFFKPPQNTENLPEEELDEELQAVMAVDYELGEVLRQSIIPKAALYYTGYIGDDDDDVDDDDDDDEDDDDSDSSLGEAPSDESEGSDDSLHEHIKDKKRLIGITKKNPKT